MSNQKPSWDERMEALTQQLELVSEMQRANERNISALTEITSRHERDWERFRHAMQAGLEAWFNGNGNQEGN